jgi:uncharacterized protein YjbI with pentapeptide repeats
MDPNRLVVGLRALYPDELLQRYAAGERDFHGINLLRAEIEGLASEIDARHELPEAGVPFGYWGHQVSPLWVDRRMLWEPLFHWEGDEFQCLLEDSWEEHAEWPEVAVKDLRGADLSDINLQGAYLYRVNLNGTRLVRAKLQAAILVEVDASGAILERADLRETRAIGVQLTDANLYLARLQRAALMGADLSYANLARARLRRASLALTTWRGADLHMTRFSRNNMMGSDLRGLDMTSVDLADAAVYGSMITPEQEANLLDALAIIRDPDAPPPQHVWLPSP